MIFMGLYFFYCDWPGVWAAGVPDNNTCTGTSDSDVPDFGGLMSDIYIRGLHCAAQFTRFSVLHS